MPRQEARPAPKRAAGKGPQPEVRVLNSLQQGRDDFHCTGFAGPIKITTDGQTSWAKLPVSTRGLRELFDDFNARAPRVPIKPHIVGREEASQKGLPRGHVVYIEDHNDLEYKEALARHQQELNAAMVGLAFQGELKDRQGEPVSEPLARGRILSAMLSLQHFTKLVEDVMALDAASQEELENLSSETSA